MAKWKYHLNLSRFYHSDIPISEKGKLVADAIRKTFPAGWLDYKNDKCDNVLEEIVDQFERIYSDEDEVDEFDFVMADLYDWADSEVVPLNKWPPNRLCWVETG